MKRLPAVPVVLLLVLSGCAAGEAADPLVTCIDVNVEYGLQADREEARELCTWLREPEREGLLDAPFDDVFSDVDRAREWAQAEAAKES